MKRRRFLTYVGRSSCAISACAAALSVRPRPAVGAASTGPLRDSPERAWEPLLEAELRYTGVDREPVLTAWLNLPEGSDIGPAMARLFGASYTLECSNDGDALSMLCTKLPAWAPEPLRLLRRLVLGERGEAGNTGVRLQLALGPPGIAEGITLACVQAQNKGLGGPRTTATFVIAHSNDAASVDPPAADAHTRLNSGDFTHA